jgi:hypothetical protein
MKNLFKNIWQAPASTIAGGLVAAIGVAAASDAGWSKETIVTLSTISAFLAVFAGPKPTVASKLPLLLLCGILTIALPSCGTSFSISGPLPDDLGGGSATIIITPAK